MPYLEFTDTRFYYEIDDATDPWEHAQNIVLVHGFAENVSAWRAWVPHLARRFRVIRFDQRGFGRSNAVDAAFNFSTELLADDLVRIVNHLAGEPVHFVAGKSAGISVSRLAANRPDLVRTLTLASSPLLPPNAEGWIAHMEQHGLRSWARSTMRARMGSAMPECGLDWWVDMMGATALSTAHAYMRWVSGIDVRPDLPRIECPTLVLMTNSARRSREELDAYRSGLKYGEFVTVPIDGYHAAGSAPDDSARAVLEFIDRHATGRHAR